MIERVILWQKTHIGKRPFILFLAFLTGAFAAIAALLLHGLIDTISALLFRLSSLGDTNRLYLIYPLIGIIITSLFVRFVVRDDISHGITRVLYAISSKRSRLKLHNCWSSIVASATTIGFGGSVGAEAPIVLTGSAIGSNLGRLFRMDNKTLTLLVGCGGAGAIAGIFKAPIAGLAFSLEVLMIDLTMASLLPVLVSCVVATCLTYIFRGTSSLFDFHIDGVWSVQRIPASMLLGVFCGLIGLYFIRAMTYYEGLFARFRSHNYACLLIGGSIITLLIGILPSLYGEGYHSISILLNSRSNADWNEILNNSPFANIPSILPFYIALIILAKAPATAITNGAGGCGGTFAPCLYTGCFCGFLFARLWNIEGFGTGVQECNFALLGMAGMISGVMHAPLTGTFLIAEITGGYDLLLPLMIVSVCSYLTTSIFEEHNIYSARLARQGRLITHNTDRAVLTLMNLSSIIDRDYCAVTIDMNLARIINSISLTRHNVLPVLDIGGRLLGEIRIADIRHLIFRTELYSHFDAKSLMKPPKATLSEDSSASEVIEIFEKLHTDSLPIIDRNGCLLGYITREKLYSMYRQMVADMSED